MFPRPSAAAYLVISIIVPAAKSLPFTYIISKKRKDRILDIIRVIQGQGIAHGGEDRLVGMLLRNFTGSLLNRTRGSQSRKEEKLGKFFSVHVADIRTRDDLVKQNDYL